MTNQTNLLSQVQAPQGLEKHRLSPADKTLPVPEIDHWVLQLWGVSPQYIDNTVHLNTLLRGAVEELHLTPVSSHSHYFGPGVSAVIILSESHLSAHTWPELGYIHLDLVTCARQLTRQGMEAAFRRAFTPHHLQMAQLEY